MKQIFICFFLTTTLTTFSQEEATKVLFLGNSYTFFNDLPTLFENFSNAAGDSSTAGFNTPGGYTLQGHSTNQMSIDMINAGDWNYVVLQEQSQLPSFPINQVEAQTFPFASKLDTMINTANPCAETVFFMTWRRENGDASNCATWPPVCTYEGMDSLLYKRYMQMAEDNNAIVSPVGAVWRFIRTNMSNINLYDNDGSHPSAAGSYAAACAFYSVIHRKSPANVPYDFTLNALEAFQIRQAAKLVVFDSLNKWFVGAYDSAVNVEAEFEYDIGGLNATFLNTSTNATSAFWEFGDGATSTDYHPFHAYPGVGQYHVTLTAYHCDSADTSMQTLLFEVSPPDTTIDDSTTGLSNFKEQQLKIWPNPTDQIVNISGLTFGRFHSIEMVDLFGRVIYTTSIKERTEFQLEIGSQGPGIYILKFIGTENSHLESVIIQ